ncbi:hypothetical protein M885DRAFT_539351 [Pelagophyceae sp. CCMP2097]|nr:hypothetical protein M885DRAFT_539351 [Pelagophyceae sp. CCMP2097]|eukprot:CAMPEP_0206812598 /NCGR_PEP_ID=MMETSP0975-20121206/7848_1 /ASSEMBLY_ACC=CAM_ASM_000399 /TAXON_ID=483370 /ORGANISM="non described non described, Strain CCMP2097" /LENGTH=421 /DNA_ID=CAMNT_0054354741 /DNA_START=15 /DNA_END=1280 /DNA_ORIENTATION=+
MSRPGCTVHVGNLSPSIQGEMLRSIFGHFGPIVDIRLVNTGNGPTSYGFVDFATEAAASGAMAMSGAEFDGRRLRVEIAKHGTVPPASPVVEVRAPVAPTGSAVVSAELFVGGLSLQTTSDSLRNYFSQFGAVAETSVVTNRSTGASKGYGFARFLEQRCADAAAARGPHLLDGRVLNVEISNLARVGGTAPPTPAGASLAPPAHAGHAGGHAHAGGGHTGGHSSHAATQKRHLDEPDTGEINSIIIDHLMDCGAKVDEYTQKVVLDTRQTCSAFGPLGNVQIPRPKYAPQRVFVEFQDAAHAAAACESLGARTYDGRKLAVKKVTAMACRREARDAADAADAGGDAKRRRADDAEVDRLRVDAAHHSGQHKAVSARAAQLEDELDSVRNAARNDREFAKQRIKSLEDRLRQLEDRAGAHL